MENGHPKTHSQVCVLNSDNTTHNPEHRDAHDTWQHCLGADTEGETKKTRTQQMAPEVEYKWTHFGYQRRGWNAYPYHPWPTMWRLRCWRTACLTRTTRFDPHSQCHGQEKARDRSGASLQLTLWAGNPGHPSSEGPRGILENKERRLCRLNDTTLLLGQRTIKVN